MFSKVKRYYLLGNDGIPVKKLNAANKSVSDSFFKRKEFFRKMVKNGCQKFKKLPIYKSEGEI